MKITATFDSLEEFQAFISRQPEAVPAVEAKPEPEPEKEKAEPVEEVEAEKPKKEAKKEAKKEEPKADYDALRVEVRKVLAELNKLTGKNTAAEIIKAHGATGGKLSQIEDLFLPALLEEAKEALEDAK